MSICVTLKSDLLVHITQCRALKESLGQVTLRLRSGDDKIWLEIISLQCNFELHVTIRHFLRFPIHNPKIDLTSIFFIQK